MTDNKFKSKYGDWALITGASSGMGFKAAHLIAQKGLNVILVARRQKELKELASNLCEIYNIKAKVICADLSSTKGIEEVKSVKENIGLIVLCAGMQTHGSFLKRILEEEIKMINLNVTCVFHLVHHFSSQMEQRGRGGILLISSLFGHMPSPYFSNYASTKAYVSSLGVSIYKELKPKGIDVAVLSPGLTDTPMTQNNGIKLPLIPLKARDPLKVVEAGLNALGKKPVVVVGFENKIMKFLSDVIPYKIFITINEFLIRKSMPKDKL